jgi:DNA-binding IclR family transcriptional regulator
VTLAPLDANSWKLLQTQLDSFEKLELVRALRASGRPMSRDDLEVECRVTSDTVHEALESLSRTSIVEFDAATKLVRLGPSSHDPALQALMEVYEDDRLAVLALLSTMVMERLRSMTAQAFADAFALRKKRDDGDG